MDKFVDKLMESTWTVRGLALILALLLFATAYIDEKGANPIFTSESTRATVEDVPVVVFYEEENFVVTGVPQTVNVVLEGNNSLVQSARNLRDFMVYLDLTDAKIGSQRVEFKVRDLSDKLRVSIQPSTVVVNVQEKVTQEFTVEAEFNRSMLEEGYTTEEATVEPNVVKITGGKDVIEQITYVKAIIESGGGINETFRQRASISVLDKNLNKLDVKVEPERVNVTIPVVSPKKTVPVSIRQTGTPKEGLIIKSIEPHIQEVVIFGKKSVIDSINRIEIPIDVSKINGDEEQSIPIELVPGLQGATPESVNVTILTDIEQEITLENIPINYLGLGDEFILDFLEPDDGQVDITVSGPSEVVKNITVEDFTISMNVAGLEPGEHTPDIVIRGPRNVEWETEYNEIKIVISETEE